MRPDCRIFGAALVPFLVELALIPGAVLAATGAPPRLDLREGWALQSSRKVGATGEVLSTTQYTPEGWYRTTVPSTVVAAQLAAGDFEDPYVGMNLRKIPGTTYPIAENFTLLPMAEESPYAVSWWYRTELDVPASFAGRTAWLHFGGINYRANVWLNGRKLADAADVAGAYRIYELDVTSFVHPGQRNVLAVETFAPTPTDLAINWVDWNPTPPDKDMGLWGDVYLVASGPVALRHPFVATHFPDTTLRRADLTLRAELRNASTRPMQATVEAELAGQRLRQRVDLAPGEARPVVFTPEAFPQLRVPKPKVWWPAPMGEQPLHDLTMRVLVDDAPSDEQRTRFGIREVTAEMAPAEGHLGEVFAANVRKIIPVERRNLLFRVNGKRILIRGGGWTTDMLLRPNRARLETELRYVRHMGLNTIRLEGKLERDELYELADELGILVMAGWCCCDHWESWDRWRPGDREIATASLRDQILRIRSHPSLLFWLNGSDGPPPAPVETAYIAVLKEVGWPNPYISSAAAAPAEATGASGVKMPGPYDYVPPSYWTADPRLYGGPLGFNTETSPGAAIPLKPQLRKMLGNDHLWPIDDVWRFHAGSRSFRDFKKFNAGMETIYGPPADLDDYLRKAQAMTYDGERAMFEAFGGNKYNATGLIQWMLNNGWPSLFWHLYDWYLQPAGGFYGAKKACEPLHVQYSYADRGVVVVNSLPQRFAGLSVDAALYDFAMKERFRKTVKVDVEEDGRAQALTVPPTPANEGGVSFLKLTLRNGTGEPVSTNFYWVPAKPTVFDWAKTDGTYTPATTYEDLTMLARLPVVRVEATPTLAGDTVTVRLHNPSPSLAFQVHLGLHQGDAEEEIVPVYWDDNYVSLLPGESRVLTARSSSAEALRGRPTLGVDGWNVEPARLPLSP